LINDAQDFWSGLADFYRDFEDRLTIENFWDGMLIVLKELFNDMHHVSLSRALEFTPHTWEDHYFSIDIVASGVNDNRINETNYFGIDDEYFGIYSAPTLTGIPTDQILTEGTDFEIINNNTLHIFDLDALEYDTTNTAANIVKLYADTIYRVNPVILRFYRILAGLELLKIRERDYWPYTYSGADVVGVEDLKAFWDEKSKMLKYMSWGVFYLKLKQPTIKNLEWILNILYNRPFVYKPGTVSSIAGNIVVIDNDDDTTDTYYLDGGYTVAVAVSEVVSAFQPLASGIEILDNINDTATIEANFDEGEREYGIIVTDTTSDYSQNQYKTTVVTNFLENFLGKQYNYILI